MVARRAAVFILITTMATTCAAVAEDAIKPGKWEYSTTVPGANKLPEAFAWYGYPSRAGGSDLYHNEMHYDGRSMDDARFFKQRLQGG
jgi:hypothetical protein